VKILFCSPEAMPFAKTGGLADVAGAMPGALKKLGLNVHLVLPLYRTIREKCFDLRPLLRNLMVPFKNEVLKVNIFETQGYGDVPVYLIENNDFYDRPHLYGNGKGDYPDNLERFAFFSHALLRCAESMIFPPDLIHCNDWQTGLIPALLKGPYSHNSILKDTPSVFTIHNIGYQGLFSPDEIKKTGLSKAEFFHINGLEYWGKISLLKSGIVYSNAITTVSPRYARDILTPKCGMGMEGILSQRKAALSGILNGVDYCSWNPAKDPHIAANFSTENLSGKGVCKNSLMKEMDIDTSLAHRPFLAVVSRLDAQKGIDLLVKIIDKVMLLKVGLIVLGSGNHTIQQDLRQASRRYPGRFALKLGFDEPLAHRIIAGADIFLVPSRYEPCGLTQMYAPKYGTVPVVRKTGGLDDTISEFDPGTNKGNGFKFGPYKSENFLNSIEKAVKLFQNTSVWKKIMDNGMRADFSWDYSARQYLQLYKSVISDQAPRV